MIKPFWGEFLTLTTPLELALNYCSHKCAYCFANLNAPNRKADSAAVLRQLAKAPHGKTYTHFLLRQGYPVALSNHVDPFALSNYRTSLPLIEAMTELGIPIQFQTRGGRGVDEALAMIPRSLFYISLTGDKESVVRPIEPGAPTHPQRMALIEKLRKEGHAVVIGLNPLVPDWWDDLDGVLRELFHLGVKNFWLEPLHLNTRQQRRMTEKEKAVMGPAREMGGSNKKRFDVFEPEFERVTAIIKGHDGEFFTTSRLDMHTRFFDIYRDVYPMSFPVMPDFVNEADRHDPGLWDYAAFKRAMSPHLPEYVGRIGQYVSSMVAENSKRKRVYDDAEMEEKTLMSMEDMLRLVWNSSWHPKHLAHYPNFAIATDFTDPDNPEIILDDDDNIYLIYDPEAGFDSYHIDPEPYFK